ncbi:MAG: HYR domain-containing protein [Chloroflexota bacterium]
MLRRAGVVGVLVLASLIPAGAHSAPPPLRISDPTVEATGPDGANATYEVKAFDPNSGNPLAATCDPPAGAAGSGDFSVTGHFPLGQTTVTCNTTTEDQTPVQATGTVTVRDTTPPAVTAPANVTTSTDNPGGTAVTYGAATASDIVDGSLTPTCSPASGSTFPVGTTTVTCTATDSHGNTGSASFTVTVSLEDTVPPVVTVPADFTVQTGSAAGTTVTFSASATDDRDGALTPTCSPASGSTFPVGTTQVTCTATDSHGNTGSASFNVTVVADTTPPVIQVPSDISVNSPDPAGAAVTYTASASDNFDGAISPTCAPASGAVFPIGATTVTCTAQDAHGNSSQATFKVTVVLVDATPPAFGNVPPTVTREADGPAGSAVTYDVPTAVDNVDGPIPVTCSPLSGKRFPLGVTKVQCSATDAQGNTGTATFDVKVVDTAPPRLLLPPNGAVYATSPGGIPRDDPVVQSFLNAAGATDLVDEHPSVTNDAPQTLPVGNDTVTFVARDASGNSTTGTAVLNVKPQPPPGTPQLPPTVVDRTPPGDVTGVSVKVGNRLVRIRWKNPPANDFAYVLITRSLPTPGAEPTTVYKGKGVQLVDRKVTNGISYRYLLLAFDQAGNASGGVAVGATPRRQLLTAPPDGAKVKKPPKLVWIGKASFFNVQLYRGKTKVLSTWPTKSTYVLKKTWKYDKRRYRMSRGAYRWYVWPAFGSRSRPEYGGLLGTSAFTYAP